MVSAVKEVPGTRNLRLNYATTSSDGHPELHEEEFEMVVLSVGLKPTTESQVTAERLGVALNEFGFAESPAFHPTDTSRPGVFVAGAFAEPKDIPETVIEASCAAAQASALLAEARGTLTREPVYPPERDVSEEEARVGVFVCHCGINIGGVVDVQDVVDHVADLPNVAYAAANLLLTPPSATCAQQSGAEHRTPKAARRVAPAAGGQRRAVSTCISHPMRSVTTNLWSAAACCRFEAR